jgi:hypothetical protein
MLTAYKHKGEGVTKASVAKLESDYKEWLCSLLSKHFRNPDPEQQFAPHHKQFYDWGWNWKPEQQREDGSIIPPACLWVVNRGGNKSTSVAGLAVGRGARKLSKYGLVITRTETQGDTHVRRVNSMLLSSNVGSCYPGMAKPEVKEVGNRKVSSAWNRTQLTTADGWTLQSFSLQASLRGVGLEEYRPDFIWITDIDDENDSVGMVETLENALSSSVLATMASDCMVIFDQNLIHRGSIMNRIYTRKSDVLSDRETVGAIPALRNNPTYERKDNHWFITSGTPTWSGMDLVECERKLNLWGKRTWEREAQHNINMAYPDAVYGMWDEVYHVITWSEFARFFAKYGLDVYDQNGNAKLPSNGRIVQAQDWGNNTKHPCANRWAWRAGEKSPLHRDIFFYREMCFPRFPVVENDTRRHPSALKVGIAIQEKEKEWDEAARMDWRLASHERPEIIEAYASDLPMANYPALEFESINTSRARDGILKMQDFLTIEEDQLHPFRVYPVGHPEAGKPLRGKPRIYFIVADGQGELLWDEGTGQLMVRPAIDELGQARTRFEYPNYRKPDTADGAERKDAPKIDDDVIDCDRAIAGDLFPTIEQMTQEEKVEALMKKQYPKYDRQEIDQPDDMGHYFAYHRAKRQVESEQPSQGMYFDLMNRG